MFTGMSWKPAGIYNFGIMRITEGKLGRAVAHDLLSFPVLQ